jgi:ACS family glucarate transporter-like MFS transporter
MPARFRLIGMTFLLSMLLYVDRVAISTARNPVTSELGLSDTQFGWILSAFALGYALFQVPSGVLADRLGPRVVLSGIVTVWSIFTALTGAVWNLASLLVVRFLFGAGEAGAFPACARAFYSWLPASERGLAQGVNFSGSRLGAAFALPAVAWLVTVAGWRLAFLILGVIGALWALVWWWWFRDTPEEHPAVAPEERQIIAAGRAAAATVASAPLTSTVILRSSNMWIAMGQYFASNFTFFFCLTWLFPYLQRTYQLEAVYAGLFSAGPLLAGAVGNWVSGWVVDRLYRQNRRALSRKGPAIAGFVFAAVGLLGSLMVDGVMAKVLFLSVAIFGADMTLPPSWAFCIDVGRQHAGAVAGTMNMAGNLGSFVTSLAFPYLLDATGSPVPFFVVGAGLNVIAAMLWLAARPLQPIGTPAAL